MPREPGARSGTSRALDHVSSGGRWSREEIERELACYQERGAAGDWDAWAEQLTEDAVYLEHHDGS